MLVTATLFTAFNFFLFFFLYYKLSQTVCGLTMPQMNTYAKEEAFCMFLTVKKQQQFWLVRLLDFMFTFFAYIG